MRQILEELLAGILLYSIVIIPPVVPLLIVWGRWTGRHWRHFESSKFYPQCKSRAGLTAISLILASLMALPVFVLGLENSMWTERMSSIGILLAFFGLLTALFARRGVRGLAFCSAAICLIGWLFLALGISLGPDPD